MFSQPYEMIFHQYEQEHSDAGVRRELRLLYTAMLRGGDRRRASGSDAFPLGFTTNFRITNPHGWRANIFRLAVQRVVTLRQPLRPADCHMLYGNTD